jgi:hypothetical protein
MMGSAQTLALPVAQRILPKVYRCDRLGLCPGAKWYDVIAKSYIYPPQGGFQLNTASQPIQRTHWQTWVDRA